MDHEEAIKLRAAERYILEELSPDERDDFEEHYFMCVECADEVRSVFALADNAKSVFAGQAQAATPRPVALHERPSNWWLRLRPAVAAPAAAALLLGVTLYQSVWVIPRLERDLANVNQAQTIPSVVARPATRGEDPVVEISEHDRFVQLILDLNVTIPDSFYTLEVYDEAGSLRFSVPAPAPSRGSLHLLLPVTGLKPGPYMIRVRPKSGAGSIPENIDEYNFVLRSK